MGYPSISKQFSLFYISALFGVFFVSVSMSADTTRTTAKQFENNIIDEIKTWDCLSSNPEAMAQFKNCVAPLLVSEGEIVAGDGEVGKKKGCSGHDGTRNRNIYDCIELISSKCPAEFEASVFPAKCINNPQ